MGGAVDSQSTLAGPADCSAPCLPTIHFNYASTYSVPQMGPNAPFFPLRNPIKDEDAPQKKRKRSRADGEDTAGSLSLPARTSDLLPYPVQETSASPRASTSSSVAADAQTAAAEGSSLTRPPSSTSNLGIERAGPHQTTKSESLPPSTQPSHCRSLSESTLPQISPAHPSATSLPQAVSPDLTPSSGSYVPSRSGRSEYRRHRSG